MVQKLEKWHSSPCNLKIGDIVVIQDTNLVPSHWPLAKVTKTYPGNDGVVRVAIVKTTNRTYNRQFTSSCSSWLKNLILLIERINFMATPITATINC